MKKVVEVKIITENGKCLLSDTHPPLKEGDIILASKINTKTGWVDFKWKGLDACLLLNENCVISKSRKKPINSNK